MDAGVNWLWQGCLVSLALFVMLRLLERARANVRYVVCWAALLLIVLLPALPSIRTYASRPDALPLMTADAIVSMPDAWWTSSAAMLAAWMVWASVGLVRFAWGMAALRRARGRSRAFPSHVESGLRHWQRVRSTGRRPGLVLSESVPTAAVLGCGAPIIAVAPSLVETLDAEELDRVLIHEWAHVQRRDDLVNIAQIMVRIVAGWHPAVWWIERRLRAEREIACDETTVALTGSPKSYAQCLVKLASLRGPEASALAAPAVLTASGLRARIARIVSRHASIAPFWSRAIATGVVLALCVIALGSGGLRLVEVTAFALPFESIRMVDASFAGSAPAAAALAAPFGPARPLRQSLAPAQSAPRRAAEAAPPAAPVTARDPEVHVASDAHVAVDSAAPDAIRGDDADTAVTPESATALDKPRVDAADAAIEQSRSPWAEVADRGTTVGRRSRDAGVATAGFFTGFARRVAGSF